MAIVKAVIRKIWLVLLLGVLMAALAYGYVKVSSPKLYETSMKLLVITEEEHDDINAIYQKWRPTAVDYGDIIRSRPVLESVIEKMDLDMTPEELSEHLIVNVDEKSTIVYVYLTSKSGDAAVEMMKTYKDALMDYLENDIDVSLPVVLEMSEKAVLKDHSKFGTSKTSALGFIAGVLLALIIIVLLEMYNEKIRDSEEAEECLKVRTLADYSGKVPGQAEMLKGQIKIMGDDAAPLLFAAASPAADKDRVIREVAGKFAANGVKVAILDFDKKNTAGSEDPSGFINIIPEKGANDMSDAELEEKFREAAGSADIVLVNAPDMRTSIDAAVIAKYCKKAVLVIRKGNVRAADALKMKEQLEESGCALAGTVIIK